MHKFQKTGNGSLSDSLRRPECPRPPTERRTTPSRPPGRLEVRCPVERPAQRPWRLPRRVAEGEPCAALPFLWSASSLRLWGAPPPGPLLLLLLTLMLRVPTGSVRKPSRFKWHLVQGVDYQGPGGLEGPQRAGVIMAGRRLHLGLEGQRGQCTTRVRRCPCCAEQNDCPASHPLSSLAPSSRQGLADPSWLPALVTGSPQQGREAEQQASSASAGMWRWGLTLSRRCCPKLVLCKEPVLTWPLHRPRRGARSVCRSGQTSRTRGPQSVVPGLQHPWELVGMHVPGPHPPQAKSYSGWGLAICIVTSPGDSRTRSGLRATETYHRPRSGGCSPAQSAGSRPPSVSPSQCSSTLALWPLPPGPRALATTRRKDC